MRFQNERHQEDCDCSEREADDECCDEVDPHLRNRTVHEQQRTEDQADHAADTEDSVTEDAGAGAAPAEGVA